MAEIQYTDHDLLVISLERLSSLTDSFKELKDSLHDDLKDLRDRVTILERQSDKQTGFFSGAKFIWGIIGALPPSVILLFRN